MIVLFFYVIVAVGKGKNAASIISGGPSVPRSALFAHGDHPDVWKSRTQYRAPI